MEWTFDHSDLLRALLILAPLIKERSFALRPKQFQTRKLVTTLPHKDEICRGRRGPSHAVGPECAMCGLGWVLYSVTYEVEVGRLAGNPTVPPVRRHNAGNILCTLSTEYGKKGALKKIRISRPCCSFLQQGKAEKPSWWGGGDECVCVWPCAAHPPTKSIPCQLPVAKLPAAANQVVTLKPPQEHETPARDDLRR